MSLPSYKHFIFPLLQVLSRSSNGIASRDAVEQVANSAGLSDEQRKQMLPSGAQPAYQNRILWAHDCLKRFGFSAAPRRGFYLITEAGREFLDGHPEGVDAAEINRKLLTVRGKTMAELEGREDQREPELPDFGGMGAEERIEQAMVELRASVASDLLEQIAQAPAEFFERLVLDVLHAAGYGVTRKDVVHTGKSGDEGIDGIISLDRLGLQKVYVQAKRWQTRVGRPEIQAFYGSLAGHRATYGVFITTSDFSREAREYAEQVSDTLVLVDGRTLAGLMIDHKVGVSHRILKLGKVDQDYFEVG